MTGTDSAARRVAAYLKASGRAARGARAMPLTGDASDRQYYRVLMPDEPSIVLALYAGAFDFDTLPFVNVARLFAHMPVPIPEVLGHDEGLGVIALQDLGDVTLQAHVGAAPATDHAALYRQAVALIATLQRRGADLASDAFIPYGVAFDVEKLTWEFEFFLKHFLASYRGVTLRPAALESLRREFGWIVEALAAEPRVLCHRDYHSRNLMLRAGRLYMIDFQDARMGPDTYDLVSLLRDAYVDLTEAAVEDLMAYFLALKGATTDAGAFPARCAVMALQRNLKALGTFGYQTAVRGNPVYIQYIPRTLRCVRDNLASDARFARIREVLAPELAELG